MASAGEFKLIELAYHLRELVKKGLLLEQTHEAPAGGAREVFYFSESSYLDSPP